MKRYIHRQMNHEINMNTRRRFNFHKASTLRYQCRIDVSQTLKRHLVTKSNQL